MREFTADGGLPPYVSTETIRSRVVPGLAIAIVLSLMTAMVGAVAIRGAGSAGAASPDEAVHQLVNAATHADVLGALDVLDPAERDLLTQPIVDAVSELTRLQVLGTVDLHHISGVEAAVGDLATSSKTVGDGVADVTITGGRLTSTVDPAGLPLGAVLRGLIQAASQPLAKPETSTTNLASEDLTLATVRHDGRWFVSIGYSIAEAARKESGKPAPAFGHGVPANGADTPAGAVTAAIDAAVAFDVRRLVELTPPGEAAALHDYAPLFLPDAEHAIAAGRSSAPVIKVSGVKTSSAQSGHRAAVTIEGFHADASVPGQEHATVDYDGACLKITGFDGIGPLPCTTAANGKASPALRIATVEEGGAWFVSPTRTVLDGLVAALRSLNDDALKGKGDPASVLGSLSPLLAPFVGGVAGSASGCDQVGTPAFAQPSRDGLTGRCRLGR